MVHWLGVTLGSRYFIVHKDYEPQLSEQKLFIFAKLIIDETCFGVTYFFLL